MSTQIDERVVQMKFDNASFEKNAGATLSTLDKLKNALNFKGAEKGLRELQEASNHLDMSGLEKSADKIGVKFDAMSMVAISAINRIVNSAMSAGEKILKSLTIEPPTVGFSKYEEKTKAVVTIMNATGKSIDEVNEQLERLNLFTDETSYNFTDMVSNIGKFTSNNVPLEQAVNSMQGIANLAAISGQGINEASRAMYNFAQAVSVGSVKLMDWRSIQNANMATSEFKQTIIDTALEMGTLKKSANGLTKTLKGSEVSATNFENALSEGWFTSDVLLKSLDKYGSYATEVLSLMEKEGITCSEAMEQLGGDMNSLGARAFRAAQEAKTFTDAIEATKDAVSTGWSKTFEIIFGDYNEAKEMWTALTNELYDLFAASAEGRNEILKEWKDLGGRTNLLEGISKAWTNLKEIMSAVKQASDEMFPALTGERLKQITDKFGELADSLKLSEEGAYTLKVAVKALLLPIKVLAQVIGIAASLGFAFTKTLFKMGDAFLSLFAKSNPLEDTFKKIFGEERYLRLASAWDSILTRVGGAFTRLSNRIKNFTSSLKNGEKKFTFFETLWKYISPIVNLSLDGLIWGMETLAKLDFSGINTFAQKTLGYLTSGLKSVKDFISPVTNQFKELFNTLKEADPSQWFGIMVKQVENFKNKCADFLTNFSLSEGWDKFEEKFPKLASGLKQLSDAMVDFVKKLNPSKILVYSFGVAITGLIFSIMNVVNTTEKAVSNLSGVFTTVNKVLKGFAKQHPVITQLTQAIAVLTAALVILSKIPADDLKKATISLISVIGVFGILAGAAAAIDKFVVKDSKSLWQMALSLTAISGAILVLALAMKTLSTIRLDSTILKSLGVLSAIIAELLAVSLILGKAKISFSKNMLFFAIFAGSINTLVGALKKLDGIRINNISSVVASLGLVMLAMAGLAKAMDHIDLQSSAGVTLMIVNFLLLVKVLQKLSTVDPSSLTASVKAFIPLLAAIAALNLTTRLAGKNAAQAGKYILAISLAMIVLQTVVKSIGELDTATVIKGTAAISAILIMFGVITSISHFAGNTKGLGKTILAMSTAILLLGLAIDYIGGLDSKEVAQGTVVVSGLLLMFGMIMKVGSVSQKAAGTILAMSLAIGLITSTLMLLRLVDWKELLVASGAFSAAIIAFGVAMGGIAKVLNVSGGGSVKALAKSVLTILAVLGPIAGLLYLLRELKPESAIANAAALSEVMIVLSTSMVIMSRMKTHTVDVVKRNMMAMAGVVAATTIALIEISSLSTSDDIIQKATALGIIMSSLSTSLVIMSNMKTHALDVVKRNMISMAGLLLTSSVALIALSYLTDPDGLIQKAAALSILMLALSGAAAVMNLIVVNPAASTNFITLGIVLAEAIAALVILDKFTNADGLVEKVKALSLVLGAMTLLTGALAIIGVAGAGTIVAAASGAAALSVVIGIVGVAMAAAGALMQNETVRKVVQNGVQFFEMVGQAIGGLIGGVVGGIAKGTSSAMPEIGSNLADFMQNATPFFNGVSAITVEKVSAITNLADAIREISNIKVDKLDENLTEVGNQLVAFAEPMRSFGLAMAGVDAQSLLASAEAAKGFAEFCNALPQRDGKLDTWFGKKDMAEFGQDLADFGLYLWQYSKYVENISMETVTASANAAMSLAKLNDALPQREGGLDFFIGRKDLAEFGSDLERFGAHMAVYAHNIKDVDFGLVTSSSAAAKALAEMNKALPQRGGVLDAWIGAKDLANFGSDLSRFGASFAVYAYNIKDIPDNIVTKTQQIADAIEILVGVTPTEGGFFAKLFGGDQDFSAFANGLSAVADAANTLADSINVTQFHDLGARIIFQLSSGMLDNMYTATQAADKIAKEIIATMQDRLDIQSPSKAFYTIGGYIVKGLANGITENESIASEAMSYMASRLLSSIKRFFGIHSPSVVMKEEVGVYLVKGIADGIKSDMSAEEAAKKKAQNIISAFQDTFDKYDINSKTAELEYSLWEKTEGIKASDSIKTQKQQEMLTKKLEAQGKRVQAANAQYQATLEALGESSVQTQSAYNTWLQEQNTLADLAQQMTETVQTVNSASEDMFISYAKLMGENRANLQKMGFTDEQIESWASEQLGGYVPGMVQNTTQQMTDEFNKADVNSIIQHFTSNVAVELDYTLTEAIQNGGGGASKAATNLGVNVDNKIAEGVDTNKDVISNAVKDAIPGLSSILDEDSTVGKFAGSAASFVEGLIGGWDTNIGSFLGTVKESGLKIVDTINEALGVQSPSWKMEESATYMIEGFKNGLEVDPNPAVDAATELGKKIINAFNSAISGSPDTQNGNEKTTETLGAAAQAGANIMTEFANGISTQEEFIVVHVGEFIQSLLQLIADAAPDFQNGGTLIGASFMDAMKAIMEAKKPDIIELAKQIAQEAVDAANSILGNFGGGGGTIPISSVTKKSSGGGGGGTLRKKKETYASPGETIEGLQELKKTLSSSTGNKISSLEKTVNAVGLAAVDIAKSAAKTQKSFGDKTTNITNNFTQVNNSPKPLNRTTIYRDTKSLFSQATKNKK